ncbi:hypothetical protein [Mucilaginibacter arboris]|uniref:Outer membrane protein beta-barrel domain-containing protein n=1 Tax=Mucilaginibacter arboris TaxID=2682090 RepID=A0A7K1SRT7_9SPHI|nr:hypothetical protein [Mucilaginibacter arboris]MVN20025.1 hypothetical protein [Mucilaginibacter arboris]
MKKTYLFFAFVLLSLSVSAQIGYNYDQFSLGAGISSVKIHGDLHKSYSQAAYNVNFNYHYTPFVTFGVEAQFGKLASANADTTKSYYGEQSTNKYTAIMFHADVQLGEFINYNDDFSAIPILTKILNGAKNIYVGTGAGVIFNKMDYINRQDYYDPNFSIGGLDKSNELIIPVRIGYEYKIYNAYDEPQIRIDLGYQANFSVGDNMDGFKSGRYGDWYSQLTLGLKIGIGGVTSYRKPIHVGAF